MSVDSTLTMWQGAHTLANVGQTTQHKIPKTLAESSLFVLVFRIYVCVCV